MIAVSIPKYDTFEAASPAVDTEKYNILKSVSVGDNPTLTADIEL